MNNLRDNINNTMVVHARIKRIVRGASGMVRVETDRGGESQTPGFRCTAIQRILHILDRHYCLLGKWLAFGSYEMTEIFLLMPRASQMPARL